MSRNLIGYFGGKPNCTQYSVKFITDDSIPLSNYNEIYLAGNSPFVVTYDTNKTPFEPIRFSRASINVVASEYFFDIFSEEAQGTKVVLTNETDNRVEWVGYLTTNLLNMPQDHCNYDQFSLEAEDCLSTLEHYDYKLQNTSKSIVSFRQIMAQIANKCGQLTDMYITMSLMRSNGTYIEPGSLKISEQNFFSSDTDEPWSLKEVLTELCRYLGYTAMQYRTTLYLFDFQSNADKSWASTTDINLTNNCFKYQKSSNWNSYSQGSYTSLAKGITLRDGIVMGTGNDISLETLYNKVQVKDSFYEIDHFIPDMFKDEYLTNRQGDFWKCNQIGSSWTFKYISKRGRPKDEEKSEGDYVHYIRKFNHKNYTSIYRNTSTLAEVVINDFMQITGVDYDLQQDTQTSTGRYTIRATFTNTAEVQHTIHANAELKYDWWDGYHQMPDYNSDSDSTTFTLGRNGTSTSSRTITLTCETWWDGDYQASSNYDAWYTIDNGTKTYGFSNVSDDTKNYIGATITDVATFDKPMDTNNYLYETESDISFDRYLMIHQCDKPTRQHPYAFWLFTTDLTPLKDSQIESVYPAIMKLNSGYTNPFLYSDNAYLYLDATAVFERYNVEWMNKDWTDENTNMNGLGLFRKTSSITTITPALIFKLKLGNKYWSSQSGWTTTDSCFVVKLGTDKTDEDDVDFTGWWNEEHPVLNNVEWTDWSGARGYKIPLEVGLDMNQPIVFQVHMPSKMQVVNTDYAHDGMNNYCWVKDLKIGFATKGKDIYDNSDVLYENVINSGSVNTLSEITCKFTTYPGEGMHSYSSVGLDSGLLNNIIRLGLDGVANKPEENIIKAYSNQYSSPTIKQNFTLNMTATPISMVKDPVLGKYFNILGGEIDYAAGSQRLTLIEVKPWALQ